MPDTVTVNRAEPPPAPDRAAEAGGLWRHLGASGALRELYSDPVDARFALNTSVLRDLLTTMDRKYPLDVVLSVCVQVASALPILLGSRSPRARRVAPVAVAGRSTVALAITDAGLPGSALTDLATTAHLDDDLMVITGAKQWIVNATTADHAIVLARHRPGSSPTNFVLALVPMDAGGVSVRATDAPAFAAAGVGEIHLRDVALDRSYLLVPPGRGLVEFSRRIATERLASALWATALLRRELGNTHRRLRATTLWDNDAVRGRLAEAAIHYRQLAALCDHLCEQKTCAPVGVEAALLKAASGLAVERVLTICADLAGRDGFLDNGAQQVRARAAMFATAGGATHTMLGAVATALEQVLGSDPCPYD